MLEFYIYSFLYFAGDVIKEAMAWLAREIAQELTPNDFFVVYHRL